MRHNAYYSNMSATSINPIPCSLCGEGGHRASHCDSIGIPPDGFAKNEGGYREEGGDDDEHLVCNITTIKRFIKLKVAI